jgi:hypothetical protein
VSNTAYSAEEAYLFEMSDTYADGICCQYGAGKFQITMHGEPVAIITRVKIFETSFRGCLELVWYSTGPPSTTGWMLRTMTKRCPYETTESLQCLTTSFVYNRPASSGVICCSLLACDP